MIEIIIFEDDPKFRKSLDAYWKDADTIFVAATFADGQNALRYVKIHKPKVVLMDIEMPNVNGIDALKSIKSELPDTKVMILTTFHEDDKIFAAVCAGADGYMLKGDDIDYIEEAIIEVHNDGGFMTPSIARRVMKMFKEQNSSTTAEFIDLSERELDVLRCLAQGRSRKMIAEELFIAFTTVGDHTKNIYRKLHVNSATGAIDAARSRRIL
jgi:DNA-binding NarL/FixJ family response regulator